MQLDPHAETAIGHAAKKIFAAHRGDPNFTGCGVGFRRRAGQLTDEPAAVAMVANKRPEAIISQRRLLPKNVDVDGTTWGVDVVEVGPLTLSGAATKELAQSAATPPISGTFRPPLQGCSISNINGNSLTTGTLGCLVRDLNDGTICILSTNHVLARHNQAASGELIIQPSALDGGTQVMGIATMKRFSPLSTTGPNTVDAAIAQLRDQNHISQNVANGLMAPISPTHPAIGMVIADDSGVCARNCFLSRMDTTLSDLNVELLAASGSVAAPQVGMNIEKVGRTSGYTSSRVAATAAIVKVNSPVLGQLTFSNLIWTQALHTALDSGAVACKGGNGRTFAQLPDFCGVQQGCLLINALATYYDIPLNTAENNSLEDTLRDTFLAQSTTGQLIIGATYLNAQMIVDRLKAQTGPTYNQSMAQARAESIYAQYHDLAARLITSASPTDVVTQADLSKVESVLEGLTLPPSYGGTGMTTASEAAAAWSLFTKVLQPTVGMNRQQLIDYMNTSTVFQSVHAQMLTVHTIQTSGTVM